MDVVEIESEPSAHRVQVQKLGQPYSDGPTTVTTQAKLPLKCWKIGFLLLSLMIVDVERRREMLYV